HPRRGPVLHNQPGKLPYAEMMSVNAAAEIERLKPAAVLIKGDLTDAGQEKDWQKFKEIWGRFGERLYWVCGNHDVHSGRPVSAPQMVRIELPGAILALLDTTIERSATGQISQEQLTWLESLAKNADRPVMIFGHHHLWTPRHRRKTGYFGINPGDSEKLIALFRQYDCLIGYFSGHTHSNRVEHLPDLPGVIFAQTAALKEFPGAFFEYRVYEGGVQQIMHRVSAPESLQWEAMTSKQEGGRYAHNHYGKLAERCFTIIPRAVRQQ
ncbi:MAG TPA: metallophosphoesterase, partial [Chroococcales cyanobacterium]